MHHKGYLLIAVSVFQHGLRSADAEKTVTSAAIAGHGRAVVVIDPLAMLSSWPIPVLEYQRLMAINDDICPVRIC